MVRRTLTYRIAAAVLAAITAFAPLPAFAFSRIKDLVAVEGVRDNMLVGYGLVVGLNNSGDSLQNAPFTQQSLTTMLERLDNAGDWNNAFAKASALIRARLP